METARQLRYREAVEISRDSRYRETVTNESS